MDWCPQAASHYLSQCWLRSMLPYGNTALRSLEFYTFNCFQQMTTCNQSIAWSIKQTIFWYYHLFRNNITYMINKNGIPKRMTWWIKKDIFLYHRTYFIDFKICSFILKICNISQETSCPDTPMPVYLLGTQVISNQWARVARHWSSMKPRPTSRSPCGSGHEGAAVLLPGFAINW